MFISRSARSIAGALRHFIVLGCQVGSSGALALSVLGVGASVSAASIYSDAVQSHGPVAYWRLGETSGTTANDSAGGHHGTYQNNVTKGVVGAIAGDSNTAADFAGGGNDRVQVAGFGVSGSGLTILAWFKADGFADDRFVSKAIGTAVADHHWMLGMVSNSQLKARIKINGTTREVAPTVSTMSTGQWYFVAVTFDGSTVRLYLDGSQVGSGSYSGSVSADSSVAVGLGNQPAGADDRAFDGALDEIAVFDKALSAAEIQVLHSLGLAGSRGHWKLDHSSGTTVTDSSTFANHGTALNGPAWVSRCDGQNVLSLDGVNDYVSVPADSSLDIAGDATLSGWFCLGDTFDDASANSVVIAEKYQDNDHNLHVALVGSDYTNGSVPRGTLVFKVNGSPGAYRYSWCNQTAWQADVWYHFAITIDADTPTNNRVLINGTDDTMGSSGTADYNDMSFSADFNFGGKQAENIPGESYLHGQIAEFAVYSYQLPPSEMADLSTLVARWRLDESSGTTALDASAADNHGTYQNAVTLAASDPVPFDGAVAAVFDGSNDYVSIPNESLYDISGPLTIAVWIQVESFTKTWQAIFTKGDTAWRLSRNGNTNTIHFACSGLSNFRVDGAVDVNDGEWHHLAGVYDGTKLSLYVDGELDASVISTGLISTNNYNVEIGRNGQASGREFHGAIYDARVYNRALCPEEIEHLYGGDQFAGVKIIKWVEVQ